MAELPPPGLTYAPGCLDCGERQVSLPPPLPAVGDDFDWLVRDYDGFRLSMLEELAARFPDRLSFTPADLEVVLVEALAALLDQLSDQLDRVAAEAYLETAREPESLLRHLQLIGYDPFALALRRGEIVVPPCSPKAASQVFAEYWLANPYLMEEARRNGPRQVHEPRRMVTVDDYARRLEEHPLVLRANAAAKWNGSWNEIRLAVIGWQNQTLDQAGLDFSPLAERLNRFYDERLLPRPDLAAGTTLRILLRDYLEAFRLAGQPCLLVDAVPVPISIAVSLRIAPSYFQSEVRQAIAATLGTGADGFFRPGRLRFGEDVHSSDLVAALMALDGVESVCLNRFKRLGNDYGDQVASGAILLRDLEIALCDNLPARPERGYWRATLHGGQKG